MMMRRTAIGFLCAAALAACDKPAPEAEVPPLQAEQSALIRTAPATLSADETTNFQAALAQLPPGARISHLVVEGPAAEIEDCLGDGGDPPRPELGFEEVEVQALRISLAERHLPRARQKGDGPMLSRAECVSGSNGSGDGSVDSRGG